MNRGLPSPAVRLFRGETRVVMPSFIQEFVGTIRQVAPGEGGDRVDDPSELSLRFPRLKERVPLSLFGLDIVWKHR